MGYPRHKTAYQQSRQDRSLAQSGPDHHRRAAHGPSYLRKCSLSEKQTRQGAAYCNSCGQAAIGVEQLIAAAPEEARMWGRAALVFALCWLVFVWPLLFGDSTIPGEAKTLYYANLLFLSK